MSTSIHWFRSDLRLSDNPALLAACEDGRAALPVFILDDVTSGKWKAGGATRWWLHQSLHALDQTLQARGFHPLVLLKGDAADLIPALASEIGAEGVYWNRSYEPALMARDKLIKEKLQGKGHSFSSYLMYEPFEIKNKTGGPYKVFTPFSKAFLEMGTPRQPLDLPPKQKKQPVSVQKLGLNDLHLMPRIKWYQDMAKTWQPGEDGAHKRLKDFAANAAIHYKAERDFPAHDGVSRLSPYLHFGEISAHQVWHKISSLTGHNAKDDIHLHAYLRQLIWREFSWHLLYHAPDFPDLPWNKQFEKFPWKHDQKNFDFWKRGQTGYPIIDAGMRQLWQTGWMHNRVRMIVGSFLVKNLLIDWRMGEEWFWDTLVDADLGNNAAGWQWIAGCGADAAPYFRIFNPILQSKKFDPEGAYIRSFVPELADLPDEYIHAPWEAPPLIRASLNGRYPDPIVDLSTSRDRALEAYAVSKSVA